MRLSLARRTEYGIHLLLALAERPGRTMTAAELAAACAIPAGNVPAILSTLNRAGLVISNRGRSGGCALARRPEAVTLMEVVQALEGPVALTRCLLDSRRCHDGEPYCAVHAAWAAGRDAALAALAQTSLADVSREDEGGGRTQLAIAKRN
jgi:Rrf2 family protein